jgi:Uma2 family endonuclease
MNRKFELYRESGVEEYWVVVPEERTVHLYLLQENDSRPYRMGDTLESSKLPGFKLPLANIFAL